MWQASSKDPWYWISNELSWWEHFIPVAHDSLLQEQSMTWTTALREDSGSPSLVTSGLHPCTLPFADLALSFFFFFLTLCWFSFIYLFFFLPEVSHSHEYDSCWVLQNIANHGIQGWSRGPPDTAVKWLMEVPVSSQWVELIFLPNTHASSYIPTQSTKVRNQRHPQISLLFHTVSGHPFQLDSVVASHPCLSSGNDHLLGLLTWPPNWILFLVLYHPTHTPMQHTTFLY